MDPDKLPSPDEPDPIWRPTHRPELFQRNTMGTKYLSDLSPTIPVTQSSSTSNQLYPYHQQAFVHSTLNSPPAHARQHRSMSNLTDPRPPPPLPPKPIDYPTVDANTSHKDYHSPPPAFSSLPPLKPLPLPSPPQDEATDTLHTEDSDELAMVLALSRSESVHKRLLEERLINQEEEDLARALAASMLPSDKHFASLGDPTIAKSESNDMLDIQSSPAHNPPISLPVTPGGLTEGLSDPHDTYVEFGRYDKWRIPNRPEIQQEATPKTLEVHPSSNASSSPHVPAIDGDKSYSQEFRHLTMGDTDKSSEFFSSEAVLKSGDARQLASEEEKILKQLDQPKSSFTSYGKQNAEGRRSQSISLEEPYDRQYPQDAYYSGKFGRAKASQPDIYQDNHKLSSPFSKAHPSLGSRRESTSDARSETSLTSSLPILQDDKPHVLLDMPHRPSMSEARQRSQTLSSQSTATSSAITPNQPPSPGIMNVNHFVDHDLLRGVSIGFKGPIISTRLVQMQDQMPNIISLPYTRCPPLHIQAPDWPHLLRLMARLSGTRIEPTVDAMAVSNAEVKLRTVIQFVKPHPNFEDWRTVLWFTIDQPVPSSAPSASRYASVNPNLLPWSYTLSQIPVLLRDASDTNMSKTYTIPATDTIPLPTLPITFPDLALYLQAALDTSRRHLSDSPNGLGKLGKMVQVCYAHINQGHPKYDIVPERTKVTQYIKRVIGLSNKDKKKKGTNNEDTYQLVTPFISNEWG